MLNGSFPRCLQSFHFQGHACGAAQVADDLFLMPTLDEPGAGEGPESGEPLLAPRPAEHGLAGLVDMDFDAALQMHAPFLRCCSQTLPACS